MKPYADSNFYTKLYFRLPDSDLAHGLMANSADAVTSPVAVTWLHRWQVINAFELHLFGGHRYGQPRATPEQAAAIAQANFRHDLSRPNFLQVVALGPEVLSSKFEDISLRHTARHGFRTYDIIHVASALLLGCDTFWSFDTKASRLAALEGLKTIRQ
jgi:predicted nucleic acid-binding protein